MQTDCPIGGTDVRDPWCCHLYTYASVTNKVPNLMRRPPGRTVKLLLTGPHLRTNGSSS